MPPNNNPPEPATDLAPLGRDERPARPLDHPRTREPRVPTFPSSKHRPLLKLLATVVIPLLLSVTAARASSPFDLLPLNPASPNYQNVFANVRVGAPAPQTSIFPAAEEMLNAVYAYLAPNSPVAGDTAYRDRLFVLLDYHIGRWVEGIALGEIAFTWEASYAFALMKHHRPEEISAARLATYEEGIRRNIDWILSRNGLLYDSGLQANVWVNGDIRMAMGVYWGALALGDAVSAEKARAAIDNVITPCVLADGGTNYVGFWTEAPTYHDESVRCFIWWWKLTGSTSAKDAVEKTLRYALVANEPARFSEQSSSIPYKHMYNGLHAAGSSLWKAYLFNDGYNYHYGITRETATSTELLNAILYQPNRIMMTPPDHVGVLFDGNIQGPRGRFHGTWGWIANGRDVQRGGPERDAAITAQGYEGRQCGKTTFVGAYALGTVSNRTPLKGALDSILVEFKESPGEETDLYRGTKYRYLAQDENTSTITRKNFATLATSYRLSTRTSSNATPDWNGGATDWIGQQLWVMTAQRIIGLVQITTPAPATVYGLDARLVFTGGRRGIIGEYLELLHPEPDTFAFGQLRAKIHASTFTGPRTEERMAISVPGSTDDYSALVRLNAPDVPVDEATEIPAGTRHWLVLDITRDGNNFASPVVNVLPGNANYAVLQFDEAGREVRIVQNLRNGTHNYSGSFVVGTVYPTTSLHRSWTDTVDLLPVNNGVTPVTGLMPPYAHMIAVSSAEPNDHNNTFRTSSDIFGAAGHTDDLALYALGPERTASIASNGSGIDVSFRQLRQDVNYVVQASTNLTEWEVADSNPFGLGQEGTLRYLQPWDGGPDQLFYRVNLVIPDLGTTP